MLHAIDTKGWDSKTAWCAPTAIAFLTGAPLIHAHSRVAFLKDISLNDVEGVHSAETLMMLHEQGYRSKQIELKDRYDDAPKLSTFLKDRTSYEKCMPILIRVEKAPDFCHVVSAHFDYVADNWTMKPVPSNDFPHQNKHVTAAWVVQKK